MHDTGLRRRIHEEHVFRILRQMPGAPPCKKRERGIPLACWMDLNLRLEAGHSALFQRKDDAAVLELFFLFRGEGLGFHEEYSLRVDLSFLDEKIFDSPGALRSQIS